MKILKQCPTCRGGDECSKCLCGCHVLYPGGDEIEIVADSKDMWKNRALAAEAEVNALKQKLINVRNVACRAAGG